MHSEAECFLLCSDPKNGRGQRYSQTLWRGASLLVLCFCGEGIIEQALAFRLCLGEKIMVQRFKHVFRHLWLHVQLFWQCQALREKGVRVKKRGRLLVVDGKQPPRFPYRKPHGFIARRSPALGKSVQTAAHQSHLLSISS
jgi:hypothetical protein